jgi:microcystin-dependent protein
MAFPYHGEIRMFAGNYAPAGWALCNGQLLQIVDYEVLFQLIGTTYGGDGQTTFAVPDMRGRIPIHMSTSPPVVAPVVTTRGLGETGGDEQVTLSVTQLPAHTHVGATVAAASKTSPVWNLTGDTGVNLIYAEGPGSPVMSQSSFAPAGGSQPHNNMMPFMCVNFIIALTGIFPSQT